MNYPQDQRETAAIVEEQEHLMARIKALREDYQAKLVRVFAANAISDEGTLEMWAQLKRQQELQEGPLWATLSYNRDELERRTKHRQGAGGGAA